MKTALVKKGTVLFFVFFLSIFFLFASKNFEMSEIEVAELPTDLYSTILSTVEDVFLVAPSNDDCVNAILVPVNEKITCTLTASGSLIDATLSTTVQPSCHPTKYSKDIWFKFVATGPIHQVKILDVNKVNYSIYGAVYDRTCNSIDSKSVACFNVSNFTNNPLVLKNLVIGRTYFIRIAITDNSDYDFKVCVSTAPPAIRVSPSGEQYTVEQLVKDILVQSGCDLVSNIKYQAGDGKNKVNTLGYFNSNGADFPFEEGIVLSTNAVEYIPGPYRGFEAPKERVPFWIGDPDLNKVIDQVGGVGFGSQKAVAVLEFDFVPIKDSLKFEYLFVSDSYHKNCSVVCQPGGALFAAWLTDITSGVGQNLALVPGTTQPIALSTIRDSNKSGAACASFNPQYYWQHFDNNQQDPLGAPVNYAGMTVPMSSEMVYVKPGNKYRIKLAIADFCGFYADASSVFFNARSFNLGTPSLGDDLVIEGGSALCPGETMVLKADLNPNDYVIQWTKDGVDLVGENGPTLTISSKGLYGVNLDYKYVNCYLEVDPIQVEYFDDIIIEKPPLNLVQCKSPTATTLFNLESSMKG
ncbi:choice-of-anchor L domain-containing protein, partial [Myroides guanonis]